MPGERDNDNDLQRGFEPLRTAFAIFILLLGFAASARAESGFGTLLAQAPDGTSSELVALDSEVRDVPATGFVRQFVFATDGAVEGSAAAFVLAPSRVHEPPVAARSAPADHTAGPNAQERTWARPDRAASRSRSGPRRDSRAMVHLL